MPLASLTGGHVSDRWHAVSNCSGCSNASGELHIEASMATRHALCLHRHDTLPIAQPIIAVDLGWEGGDPSAGSGCRAAPPSTSTPRACASTTRARCTCARAL